MSEHTNPQSLGDDINNDKLEETYGECLSKLFNQSEEKETHKMKKEENCYYASAYDEEEDCYFVYRADPAGGDGAPTAKDKDTFVTAAALYSTIVEVVERSGLEQLCLPERIETTPQSMMTLFHLLTRHEGCMLGHLFEEVGGWLSAPSDTMLEESKGHSGNTYLYTEKEEFLEMYAHLRKASGLDENNDGLFIGIG